MNKKLRGLLLQVEVMEGSQINVLNENTFEVDGAEYLVLSEDEREEEFYNYQSSLIEEMGLDAFSGWAQDYIIDNFVDDEWFIEAMREHFEYYISDISEESADDEKFENRLQEEILESGCEDEEDFLNYHCSLEEPIEWFLSNFSQNEFNITVKEHDLINWEDVINWVAREDGYGCLAAYDGEELELKDDLYAYRIN